MLRYINEVLHMTESKLNVRGIVRHISDSLRISEAIHTLVQVGVQVISKVLRGFSKGTTVKTDDKSNNVKTFKRGNNVET